MAALAVTRSTIWGSAIGRRASIGAATAAWALAPSLLAPAET
jgi:hypothetical protein